VRRSLRPLKGYKKNREGDTPLQGEDVRGEVTVLRELEWARRGGLRGFLKMKIRGGEGAGA